MPAIIAECMRDYFVIFFVCGLLAIYRRSFEIFNDYLDRNGYAKHMIRSIKYDSIRKIFVLCCNFLPFSSFLLKHILNNANVMNALCFYKKKKIEREHDYRKKLRP